MTPDLVNRLRTWLRLGRTRRQIVMGTLVLGLLGGIANWAKPRVEALLFPPPTPPPAFCSRVVSLAIDKAIPQSDITAAKLWVKEPDAKIVQANLFWNHKNQQLELWMTDGKTVWKIEFICFKASLGHPMVLGKFETYSLKEVVEQEVYQESIEKLTK